jgi:hypothetical protein
LYAVLQGEIIIDLCNTKEEALFIYILLRIANMQTVKIKKYSQNWAG